MKTGIGVSGTAASATPDAIQTVADAIVGVLKVGSKYGHDQATIVTALQLLHGVAHAAPGVSNLTISGATVGDAR